FNGHDITIGDIVTHASGQPLLPAGYRPRDMDNPYADATERDLLDALAATKLTREPGSKWQYSNFAPALRKLHFYLVSGRRGAGSRTHRRTGSGRDQMDADRSAACGLSRPISADAEIRGAHLCHRCKTVRAGHQPESDRDCSGRARCVRRR